MEATTNEAARRRTAAGHPRAQDLVDGLGNAAGQAATAARQAGDGVTEFRALIRNQPVTMAALMLGLGYVLGRVVAGRHRRDDWR